jgi:hypothetical protein
MSGAVLAAAPTGMAGPVALFIIVLLCVAAYFLFRSMSRHLKRVPLDFPADPEFPELHTSPGQDARDGHTDPSAP